MKPLTIEEARDRLCPFEVGQRSANGRCVAHACMAWRIVHARLERENHSDNATAVARWAVESGRSIRRNGRPGSMGILILDEVGVCARIDPGTANAGQPATAISNERASNGNGFQRIGSA